MERGQKGKEKMRKGEEKRRTVITRCFLHGIRSRLATGRLVFRACAYARGGDQTDHQEKTRR